MKHKEIKILLLVMLLAAALAGCAPESPPAEKAAPKPQKTAEKAPTVDYLIVVDDSHPVPDGWEEKIGLVKTTNAVGDEVRTEKTAYESYLRLKEALEKEGVHVDLDSAFRSTEEQQKIIDDFTGKYGEEYARTYAAVPGTSEHHTGLALDLFLIVDGNIVYENEDLLRYPEIWAKIHEKLPEYGFILRYTGENGTVYEPWHIRYVGVEAAKEITEKGLTLEEYLDSSKG